jgi:outer membrane protein OmpA-like peptidoglycan-associated protein
MLDLEDRHGEGSGPWPAFADLLAATSLIFLILFAAIAVPAMGKANDAERRRSTLRRVEALLTEKVHDPRVTVQRVGDYLLVRIKEDATFPQREYELRLLKPAGKQILRDFGATLVSAGLDTLIDQVQVVGHASSEGSEEKNWMLSSARAATVSMFLIDSVHVPPCQISALGRSHFYPVDTARARAALRSNDQTGDPADRRIELEVRPRIPSDLDQRRRREQCVGPRSPRLTSR